MNNTLKGILFSALIFPGTGQIMLGKYLRGAIFFAVSFISGILCVTGIVRQAVAVLQGFVAKGEVITIPKIMSIMADLSTYASSVFLKAAFLIFFCCWLASVLDAWRIGRQLDRLALSEKA